jgi:Protein of unknown function (DUF2637)
VTCGDLVEAASGDVSLPIAVVHRLWAHRGLILSCCLRASQVADTVIVAGSQEAAVTAMRSKVPERTSVADLGRHRIQRVTTWGVAGLALAGFAMSYEALHALARDSGVSADLAWLWPLVVDGFIVVASMSVVLAVIESRPTWHPWALLLLFSTISVAGNVAHGPPTAIGRLVAAVPPVALVLAFDLLTRPVRGTMRDPGTTGQRPNQADEGDSIAATKECPSPSAGKSDGDVPGRAARLVAHAHATGQPVTGSWLAEQLSVSDGYARRLLRSLKAAPTTAATDLVRTP